MMISSAPSLFMSAMASVVDGVVGEPSGNVRSMRPVPSLKNNVSWPKYRVTTISRSSSPSMSPNATRPCRVVASANGSAVLNEWAGLLRYTKLDWSTFSATISSIPSPFMSPVAMSAADVCVPPSDTRVLNDSVWAETGAAVPPRITRSRHAKRRVWVPQQLRTSCHTFQRTRFIMPSFHI